MTPEGLQAAIRIAEAIGDEPDGVQWLRREDVITLATALEEVAEANVRLATDLATLKAQEAAREKFRQCPDCRCLNPLDLARCDCCEKSLHGEPVYLKVNQNDQG